MNTLEHESDDLLIRRYAAQNDREALGILFRRHADAAYSTALRVCRNSADAEDVVQSAFIRIMETAASYRGGSELAFKAWLMKSIIGTSKNKIRTEVRRRNREDTACGDQDDVYIPDEVAGQEADLKQRAAEMIEVLDDMPGQYRDVLLMHYCNGIPVKDAAAAMEMPEKNFRNTLEYGIRKLRQKLAERGVTASAAPVIAALPLLTMETAPAGLLHRINTIAGRAIHAPATAAAGAKSTGLLLTIAAATLFIAGAGSTMYFASRPEDKPVPPAPAPVPVSEMPVNYHWDFNTPGIPPELKCTMGKLRHVPGGGPDGNGCLEITGKESRIIINVPVTRFPFVIKWRSSWIATAPHSEASSKSFWFPAHDVATFLDSESMKVIKVNQQRMDRWRETVNYHSGSYIDRWADGARRDMTIGRPDPSGKIILTFFSDFLLDDLTIASIATNELPPAANYLKVLERIPADQKQGYINTPELQPAGSDKPARLYFVKGYVDETTALGPASGIGQVNEPGKMEDHVEHSRQLNP